MPVCETSGNPPDASTEAIRRPPWSTRYQATMYTTIAAASAMSTQITTPGQSTHPPAASPGVIVQRHDSEQHRGVPAERWLNFLRPVIIWMATNKANAGNVITQADAQVGNQRTLGFLLR